MWRKFYMLADNPENRRLIGKDIDVLQFPMDKSISGYAGIHPPPPHL